MVAREPCPWTPEAVDALLEVFLCPVTGLAVLGGSVANLPAGAVVPLWDSDWRFVLEIEPVFLAWKRRWRV